MHGHLKFKETCYSFFNLGARYGWVFKITLRPLYTRERDRQLILQEAGWFSGPVWTAAENVAPSEIVDCNAS